MLVQLLAITMASTLADAQQLYNPNVAYTMNLPATAGIFKGLAGFSVGCSGPTPSSCALNASFNSSMAATPFIWVDAVISNLTVKGSYTTSSSPGPGVTIHSFNSGLGVNYTGPAGDGDTIAQIDTGGSWAVSSYGIGPNKGGSGDEELSITNADLTYGLMIDGTNPTMADVKFTDIPTVLNGAINPFYTCTSDFKIAQDGIVGVGGPNSFCTFTVPDNSSFLFINGTQGPSYGGFCVSYPSWDTMGGAGRDTSHTLPNNNIPGPTLYNQPLVIRPLLPTQQYSLMINSTNSNSPNQYGISGITVLSRNSVSNSGNNASSLPRSSTALGTTTPSVTVVIVPSTNATGQTAAFSTSDITMSSSSAVGAAADSLNKESKVSGGVIGGAVAASIVGTLLIVGALFFCLRRRKQTRRSISAPYPFDQRMNGSGAMPFSAHGTMGSAHGSSVGMRSAGSSMSPTPTSPDTVLTPSPQFGGSPNDMLSPFPSSPDTSTSNSSYSSYFNHNTPAPMRYKTDINGAPLPQQPQAAAGSGWTGSGSRLAVPLGFGPGQPGSSTSSITAASGSGDASYEKPESRHGHGEHGNSALRPTVEIVTETDGGGLGPMDHSAPPVQYNPPMYDPRWQSRV